MYHKIVVAGYLGRDPEIRYLPNGTPVTTFSVASSRRWTDREGQPREETVWFRVSVFGRQGEACNQHLRKGQAVLVEGRLRPGEDGNPRVWIGNDGVARASFEVVAQVVRFLGRAGRSAASAPEGVPDEVEEEMPF